MESFIAKTARRWTVLMGQSGTAKEENIGKSPAVEWADGRNEWYRHGTEVTEAEFADLREIEVALIGEAFKTGLDHDIKVLRARPPKTGSQRPSD